MISVVNGELFRQILHSYVWWHIFKTLMGDNPTLLIIALIVVLKAFNLPAHSSHQWWQLIEYSTFWLSIYIRIYFFFFSLPLSFDPNIFSSWRGNLQFFICVHYSDINYDVSLALPQILNMQVVHFTLHVFWRWINCSIVCFPCWRLCSPLIFVCSNDYFLF